MPRVPSNKQGVALAGLVPLRQLRKKSPECGDPARHAYRDLPLRRMGLSAAPIKPSTAVGAHGGGGSTVRCARSERFQVASPAALRYHQHTPSIALDLVRREIFGGNHTPKAQTTPPGGFCRTRGRGASLTPGRYASGELCVETVSPSGTGGASSSTLACGGCTVL